MNVCGNGTLSPPAPSPIPTETHREEPPWNVITSHPTRGSPEPVHQTLNTHVHTHAVAYKTSLQIFTGHAFSFSRLEFHINSMCKSTLGTKIYVIMLD